MKQAINILFDGPPSPKSGRFMEVETDDGKSINAGKWVDRGDYWVLRITELPEKTVKECAEQNRCIAYNTTGAKVCSVCTLCR